MIVSTPNSESEKEIRAVCAAHPMGQTKTKRAKTVTGLEREKGEMMPTKRSMHNCDKIIMSVHLG